MTAVAFHFAPDPARKYLEIHMSGLWTRETVRLYDEARRTAFMEMAAHGCAAASMFVLVDRSQQSVQTADVVAELNAVVLKGPQVHRTAVVWAACFTSYKPAGSEIQRLCRCF